jgi:hypothetical protein
MGHALMDKVLIHWSNLPGNAYKVLMAMAKTGMDADLVPVYFGGWQRLAVTGLGRHDWPADDDDSEDAAKIRRAGFESVRDAVTQIKKAGAIKVKRSGKRGAFAHYSLHLDASNLWITPQPRRKTLRSNADKPCVIPRKSLRDAQENPVAKETREPMETTGEISSSPAVVSPARATTSDKAISPHLQLVRERAERDLVAGVL